MQDEPKSVTRDQWTAIYELFEQTVELPREQWSEYLEHHCSDLEVRAEAYRLLVLSDPAAEFFRSLTTEIGSVAGQHPRLEAGHLLSERFRITRFIAHGGMGEVYQAEDLELGGHVALKVMKLAVACRNGGLQRFRDEIRLARTINSVNVCRVYDVARDGELVYFTMELLDGQTLAEWLDNRGRLSLDEARPLIRQMAQGLDAAHRVGILHRDFKSGNVMICRSSEGFRVVITDFGLSRVFDSRLTPHDGGTPAYAAPEQLSGEAETPRTDIYSLGVVLYEMMTGSLPFGGADLLEIARKRLNEIPESPRSRQPDLPIYWDAVILKCLSRDPVSRFGSAPEVARALGCEEAPQGPTRRYLIAAALLLIPGAGAGTLWYRQQRAAASIIQAPSIAVLPFESRDPALGYLADGIADRLTDSLTKVPGLRVISRSAAQRLKRPEDAAQQLKVRYLFSGRVAALGKRLHVTTEIIEASTGFQTWAGTEDVDISQIETLSTALSRVVIHTLQIDARPADLSVIDRRLTTNAEAYQSYLLARYHAARRSKESLHESIDLLKRAVVLDPKFAAGWAALANSYFDFALHSGYGWREPIGLASAAVDHSRKLEGGNAEALVVSGSIKHWYDWDWGQAELDFKEAINVDPNLIVARRRYAILLDYTGRFGEAMREAEVARSLDPLQPATAVLRGTILCHMGRLDEAILEFQRVASAEPAYENTYVPLSDALERKGRLSDAIFASRTAVALSRRASFALSSLARLLAIDGQSTEANSLLDELLGRARNATASPAEIAAVYVGLKENGKANEWLEKAYAERDRELVAVKVAVEFDGLRSDSHFRAIQARMKL